MPRADGERVLKGTDDGTCWPRCDDFMLEPTAFSFAFSSSAALVRAGGKPGGRSSVRTWESGGVLGL